MSGWVRVKDRLPEVGKGVLLSNGQYVYVGSWQGEQYGFYSDHWRTDITHWQPMPEPPEKP